MRWRLILSVRCILSAPKYMTKIKIPWRKNQEPVGMNICSFCAPQEFCSKLENQAKCDSTVFVKNPLKTHFSHKFWLLEVAIIARTNYNCRLAIMPSLLNSFCAILRAESQSAVFHSLILFITIMLRGTDFQCAHWLSPTNSVIFQS